MATLKIPYLQWRNGRPRWEPGPGLRALGFRGQDLKDQAGRWVSLDAAIARARALNAEAAAARTEPKRKRPRPAPSYRTCRQLYDRWQQSMAFTKLARSTQADYRMKARAFLEEFGEAPIEAVTKPQLYGWWEGLARARGHAMANGIVAVVSTMMTYGELVGWRTSANPARALSLPTVPPRVVIWTPSELGHFVAVADAAGLRSIADATIAAVHTGQRQADILAMPLPKLTADRAFFRQAKTAALVNVPLTPALGQRIADIRIRRAGALLASIHAPLVVCESTGRPYKSKHFQHTFADVRAEAAKDMPSVAGKWFLDLRDTAVTRLALAGCTVAEIRAITGHSLETIHQVLKHYLALDDAMAKAGIERLVAWLEEQGIAV